MDPRGWQQGHRRTPGVLVGAPGGGCLGRVQIPVRPEEWWVRAICPCEGCGEAEITTFAGNNEPFWPPTTTRPLQMASWTGEHCPVELANSMTAPSMGQLWMLTNAMASPEAAFFAICLGKDARSRSSVPGPAHKSGDAIGREGRSWRPALPIWPARITREGKGAPDPFPHIVGSSKKRKNTGW